MCVWKNAASSLRLRAKRSPAHTGALAPHFGFLDYDFTRRVEDALDCIAQGKAAYGLVIHDAHGQLEKELNTFVATRSAQRISLQPAKEPAKMRVSSP